MSKNTEKQAHTWYILFPCTNNTQFLG